MISLTSLLSLWLLGDTTTSGLAYVRATSQLSPEQRGRYHPLNVLDEDPETIWCENDAGTGEAQGVTIYFKKKQRIDRILLTPTNKSGRIVQAVKVSDGSRSVIIELADVPVERQLVQPLEGTSYDITIETVAAKNPASSLPADTACLADATLYLRGALFGGKAGAEKLRFDERLDKLLGRWAGGPLGAPDKALVFSLDGTWEWNYKPLLGGKPKRILGEYRFRNNRLLMRKGEAGRWSDMQFKWQRVVIDKDDQSSPIGDYDRINLGQSLGDELGGEYTNAQF